MLSDHWYTKLHEVSITKRRKHTIEKKKEERTDKRTGHKKYQLKLTQKKTPQSFPLHPLSYTKRSAGTRPTVLLQQPCKRFLYSGQLQ